jgi:hypothetical protein
VPPALASFHTTFQHWLAGRPDDTVLRWLFGVMVAATFAVVALDYSEFDAFLAEKTRALPEEMTGAPSAEPLPQTSRDGERRRAAPLRVPEAKLREKMSFDLAADGRLMATGVIFPGTADAFAAEIAKRGSYVKTVVLQSPGGSVQDALAMGRLIRQKNFRTEVEAGHYCASSCPLVFAGGLERRAGVKALIGVHQVSSGTRESLPLHDGMEDAQRISAACQKYLRDMGIDLGVWVHAMETPKDELYYFKPTELISLKLATQAAGAENSPSLRGKS